MKVLNGLELAEFIKERQAHQVRRLRQHLKIIPKLAILVANDDPLIDVYVSLKQKYADDILIETEVFRLPITELEQKIAELNENQLVTGIIVQLPLSKPELTDQYVTKILPEKDVDGLGSDQFFSPATAVAIDWLANGYNIDLNSKKIAIVGSQGRLVGRPLMKLWSKYQPTGFIRGDDLGELKVFDLVVSATGVPEVIKPDMLAIGATVIDAGVASENNQLVGDVAPAVYDRDDITITPQKGGVGPLTVAVLMDNLIRATELKRDDKS
jgi:methylenetetrahydrofolate dehydrogenase (NADP+)/methenyltetrahydrofolate cyclohydrolase